MELLGYVLIDDFGHFLVSHPGLMVSKANTTFTCSLLFAQRLDARTFPNDLSKIGVIRITDEIALVADFKEQFGIGS